MTLENRVAVIAGATSGTGRAAARALAQHGARVALLSSNPEKLERLAAELDLPRGQALCHAADLRSLEAARGAAQAVRSAWGRVDILLQVVGGWTGGKTLPEAVSQELEEMLNQHVWTTFNLLQAFVPALIENGWGRVIAVSSPSAVRPPARGGLYAAAKAAQEALLLSLSKEAAASGVTANILQVRTIDVQHQRDTHPTSENAAWTTPEEIAAAVVYLCSEEARGVNGARLPLFGPA